MTATDGDPEVVEALSRRFAGTAVLCRRLVWGAATDLRAEIVLGGDVTYRAAAIPDLFATIASILRPGGIALLSDPRRQLEAELPGWAAAAGLICACEPRPGPYTLIRLTQR